MSEFRMPSLGSDMDKGTLIEWKVKPGDRVQRGQIVAVIDTPKAAVEIEIFEDGVVQELLVAPQEQVPVGTPLALIQSEQEQTQAEASPVVAAQAVPLGHQNLEMRKAIAAAMSRSKREIPHYYLAHEIDMSVVLDWLSRENAKRPIESRLIYAALLLKALALSVQSFPEMNGFWVEGNFKSSERVHIGVAISLRQGGLVAPAILDADRKEISQLMKEMNDLVTRARAGHLRSSEISDPSITMTNLGEQGVDSVFGVIYPPQVALVGFGRISPRKTLQATLSGDHRASDGHRGGLFLLKISQLLQRPERL